VATNFIFIPLEAVIGKTFQMLFPKTPCIIRPMLKILRKNTHMLVWLVVVFFALFGGTVLFTGGEAINPYAGEALGKKIKIREMEKQEKIIRLLLPEEAGTLPPEVMQAEVLKQFALWTAAKKDGMKVSDDELRQTIQGFLGVNTLAFNMNDYSRWTKSVLNENPRDFEETIRKSILAQKYIQKLFQNAGITPLPTDEKISEKELEIAQQETREKEFEVLQSFYTTANIKSYR
jgi:hypothetical protein